MAEANQEPNVEPQGVSINMDPAVGEPRAVNTQAVSQPAVSQTLYSSEDPNNDHVDLKQAGFDLSIKQSKPEAELDGHQENVVDSIVKQATVDKTEEEKILGELETMNPSFTAGVPIAPIAEHGSKTARNIFLAILLVAVLSVGYFFISQKGLPLVGLQANTKLAEAEVQLNSIKEEALISDLKSASLEYRSIAYSGAVYSNRVQNERAGLAFKSTVEKVDIKDAIIDFNKSLETIIDQFQTSPGLENSLLIALSDKTKELKDSLKIAKDQAERDKLDTDIELLAESSKLAKILISEEGSNLIEKTKELAVTDLDDQDFLNKLDAVLEVHTFNEYAKVAHIQESRVNWTEVIREIERVTQSIDPLFSFDGSTEGSGISYSSFAFNRDNNRVNITGQTRTSDLKTFTLIADLTDAFELSPIFSIHDSRTYSKQPDQDSGYKAAITLDVILESKES